MAPNVVINVRLPDGPRPRPEAANFFHFATSQGEFQLLVGFLDVLQIAQAMQHWTGEPGKMLAPVQQGPEADATVEPEITHRFILSPWAFHLLRHRINELAEKINLDEALQTLPGSKEGGE